MPRLESRDDFERKKEKSAQYGDDSGYASHCGGNPRRCLRGAGFFRSGEKPDLVSGSVLAGVLFKRSQWVVSFSVGRT